MITEQLKQRTDKHHRDIETVERLRRVFAEDYTLPEYIDLLKKFYGFYQPLETQFLANAPALEGLDYPARRKLPLLKQDLAYLGVPAAEIETLPLCEDLPSLHTPARILGCLYVLEGSTMGGQMISKNLSQKFNIDGDHGVSFYYCYGKDSMPMWKAFKAFIDENFSTDNELEDISASASETFEALQKWLRR